MKYLRLILGPLVLAFFACPEARAATAPDMPLPPCTYVSGQFYGACPAESEYISGVSAGRFTVGGSIVVSTVPTIPVCDYWSASTWVWAPTSCYSVVRAPTVVTCATIDLTRDEEFRELPCPQALYKSSQGLPGTLFTMRRPGGATDHDGSTACGATPAYTTYIYGGPATNEAAVWRTRGPRALDCEVTFAGPRRPDGLYGPTWAKIRVQVNRGETGSAYPGTTHWAETYVPINGDLRHGAVLELTADSQIEELDWDGGRVLARYSATLANKGDVALDNISLATWLPNQVTFESASDARCTPLKGGPSCEGIALAAGESHTIHVVVSVTNATDLEALQSGTLAGAEVEAEGVRFKARAATELTTLEETAVVKLDIPFRSGTYAQTRDAMRGLDEVFDYETDIYLKQCNVYMMDIWSRLEAIRLKQPALFEQLSYGPVTSGEYRVAGFRSDGHVGVVVYLKGTDYRKTGIIIHGTPLVSPLDLFPGQYDTQVGRGAVGEITDAGPFNSTSVTGTYYRNPVNGFPGRPHQEAFTLEGGPTISFGDGFEGRYSTNAGEFPAPPPPEPVADEVTACPMAPEAVAINTASPIDLIVTNSRGQRVETAGGQLIAQELGTGIRSMVFPHEDGTFAWALLLPPDDYTVQVRGSQAGPYRLTLTTFDAQGNPVQEITEGITEPGKLEQFSVKAPEYVAPPPPPPAGSGGNDSGGGGGSTDGLWLASILALLGVLRRRRLQV